jgi:hypothetical protein
LNLPLRIEVNFTAAGFVFGVIESLKWRLHYF